MVDLSGMFGGGFSRGWNAFDTEYLGQRQKTAELFEQFKRNNPYASFADYQSFLDQVSPNPLMRGPGYTDELLRKLGEEGERKKAQALEQERLRAIQDRLSVQKTYNDFITSALDRALADAGDNDTPDDIRARTKKFLQISGSLDPTVESLVDGMDYTGKLQDHRKRKLIAEQNEIAAAENIYAGSDISLDAIEADIVSKGFSPNVAKATRSRIEANRNKQRTESLTNFQTSINSDPALEAILADPTKSISDYIIGEARKRPGLDLKMEEIDTMRASLEARRKSLLEKSDAAIKDNIKKEYDPTQKTIAAQKMLTAIGSEDRAQIKNIVEQYVRDRNGTMSASDIDGLVTYFLEMKPTTASIEARERGSQYAETIAGEKKTLIDNNIKSIDTILQQKKKDDAESRVLSIAKVVAGNGADATYNQIVDAVRGVIAKNPNATDTDIATVASQSFPSTEQAVNAARAMSYTVPDERKMVAELYSGVGLVNDDVNELNDMVAALEKGDQSALKGKDASFYYSTVIPDIIKDIDQQIAKINLLNSLPDSRKLNLTPEGAQRLVGFAQGLKELRNRANVIRNKFDPAVIAAANDTKNRIAAEQKRGASTGAPPNGEPSQFRRDIGNFMESSGINQMLSDADIQKRLQSVGTRFGAQSSPMSYFFNSADEREKAGMVAQFARDPQTLQFFLQNPEELAKFEADPLGYVTQRMAPQQ